MPEADVPAVLLNYALAGGAVRHIQPLANAGGWSGSKIWQISDSAGNEWCLRRWPTAHPTVDRLRQIHAILELVVSQLPVVACPLRTGRGSTFIEHVGHLWELSHWLPGAADYHARPSRERLRAAMRVLARFHELAARYERRKGAAPALVDRQRRLAGMREQRFTLIERALRRPLGNEIDNRAIRLMAIAGEALQPPRLVESLAAAPELVLQPAIRDIHHDHVLFIGDEVSGLIDFGAMRIDTPLTDLARLVGSLAGDDREARRFALDVYSELRPLNHEERRLVDVLDESGIVLGALNWLMWLYVERRDMGAVEPIAKRLDELLARAERLAR